MIMVFFQTFIFVLLSTSDFIVTVDGSVES